MKIIDLYLLKKYLSTFFFVVFIKIAIICAIDYTEKSDDFIKNNATTSAIFGEYYANFIPFMANTLSPIAVFIATVFVTSRLASRTEIVAMFASGMSLRRILVPYMVGSVILGTLIFYMVGWVIPKAAIVRVGFENKYLKNAFYYDERNIHFKLAPDTYIYLESYNNQIHTGYNVTIEKVVEGKLLEKLHTDRLAWDSTAKHWHIDAYKVHTFSDDKESVKTGGTMDTVLNLYPKDFESKHLHNETLTITELEAYIKEQKERGVANIEIYINDKYERYAYPFAIIILTAMGVIVSCHKSRRGTGFQIAFGFLLAFIYVILVVMSRSIAQAGAVSPMIAAWTPNGIFFLVTIGLYYTMPK